MIATLVGVVVDIESDLVHNILVVLVLPVSNASHSLHSNLDVKLAKWLGGVNLSQYGSAWLT